MKSVAAQAILWIYCFIAVLFVTVDVPFIVAALAALLFACGNCLMKPGWKRMGMAVVYLCLSLACPQILLFTPLAMYGILEGRSYVLAAAFGVLCFIYREFLGFAAICFILIGTLVAGMMEYQVRQYMALEEKFRRTRDDSTERNLLLKEKNQSILMNQDYEIYTATLRERNRIAREIHDNVGHMLSRSILMVGAMKAVHGGGPLAGSMDQLEETLNAAMTSVRESVHDLHDESVNLKEVLESLTREFTFCPASLEYDMGYDVPREIRYSFIAVVKEALHNVAKHSNATQVKIVAREHPGLYQMIIEDNGTAEPGRGEFGQRGTREDGEKEGIGLRNMKDRVDSFGGHLEIRREKGWRIYITVPKNEKMSCLPII